MNVAMDLGYNAVKTMSKANGAKSFPSIIGTPETARFSMNGATDDIMVTIPNDGQWLIGDAAIAQSRFATRREDRNWIESPEYYRLMIAAMSETTAASTDLKVVTGLPVAFYGDKDAMQQRFLGKHQFQRDGRRGQTVNVTECRVIPQPFGALLAEALDDNGKVTNQALAAGSVAIIDVGGKTTNLLAVHRLAEIAKDTASVNIGAWDIVRQVRTHLERVCPELSLRDHEIVQAITDQEIKYFGEVIDLEDVVKTAVSPMAEQVIAQASQLWNSGAQLDAVLVAGGGAHLLGEHIKRYYRHARIVNNPVFANVTGYYKFAQRLS